MIYHVLPGDGQVDEFQKTGIAGEIIVFREALISGPVDADPLEDLWNERARFILAEYGEDEIVYHETVADEISRLLDVTDEDEVNLWFEYELFCSVNMWFCLSLLASSGAAIYRVEPIGLTEDDRWDGFGKFMADDLAASFELRTRFGPDDVELGASLWDAFRKRDESGLKALSTGDNESFPYLNQVIAAAGVEDTIPLEVVREIVAGGMTEFSEVFAEFKKRAGVYGYGDVQVRRLLDHIST